MTKSKNTLLWQVVPEKGAPPSYLFGTMHVRDNRAFRWVTLAQQYILQCKCFAAEFDFTQMDHSALQLAMTLPENESLETMLPKGMWKRLVFLFGKKAGIPMQVIRNQHPMQVSTAITMMLLSEQEALSVDETLFQFAINNNLEINGVESFSSQIETIGKIPMKQHLAGLIWMLRHFKRYKKRLFKMMGYYQEGDIQSLYKAAKKDAKGMRKVLLTNRNRRMATQFLHIAQDRPLFCAVGAGHLAGQKGMLALLKKAGCEIKPIPFT